MSSVMSNATPSMVMSNESSVNAGSLGTNKPLQMPPVQSSPSSEKVPWKLWPSSRPSSKVTVKSYTIGAASDRAAGTSNISSSNPQGSVRIFVSTRPTSPNQPNRVMRTY